jgi:F-type H+-transporting ATPase subunit epsilon
MKRLSVTVVAPEKVLFSGEADIVVAPGELGELGILPGHAPLLTSLKPGALFLRLDGDEWGMYLSGGFMEVLGDHVKVLADSGDRAEEIDIEGERERIKELIRPKGEGVDMARIRSEMARALARIRVAERWGRRRSRPEDYRRGSGR